MSLYTFLYGINPEYLDILKDIKVMGSNLNIDAPTYTQIPRFRDVYYKNGTATVLTRIGGENKADFIKTFEEVKKNPNYLETIEFKTEDNYILFNFKCSKEFKRYYLVRKIFIKGFEVNDQTKEQFDVMAKILNKMYSSKELNEYELKNCPINMTMKNNMDKGNSSSVLVILDREDILNVEKNTAEIRKRLFK